MNKKTLLSSSLAILSLSGCNPKETSPAVPFANPTTQPTANQGAAPTPPPAPQSLATDCKGSTLDVRSAIVKEGVACSYCVATQKIVVAKVKGADQECLKNLFGFIVDSMQRQQQASTANQKK